MALWTCQHLHWNWYYLYLPSKNIQFPKFYCWKSNNSLDHWEDYVYLRDLFLSNWFLFSTFSWGNTMKIPNISRGCFTKQPPSPRPILAIAAWSFSQNSKKTGPANFSLFRPLQCLAFWKLIQKNTWNTFTVTLRKDSNEKRWVNFVTILYYQYIYTTT